MKKLILMMTLCANFWLPLQAEENIKFTQVIYQESSPGVGSYPYRLLVNDDYLRLDGAKDNDDYILFDRKRKQVVSVNLEDQTRFIIQPKNNGTYKNDEVKVKTLHSLMKKSPKIEGITAKMHDIIANETLCRQVLSFDGLLPQVTQAWKEYENLMQSQNRLSLNRTPKSFQTACFLTNNITNASLYLDYGLPFSIKSKNGTLRILQSYSEVEKPASIFALPESYREFRAGS